MANPTARDRIRNLNDAFRSTLVGGRVMLTAGVNGLPERIKVQAIHMMARFNQFTTENDPHGEHDFGSFVLEGEKFFWKIDYYDPTLEAGSADPTDPTKTCRVLTLMLAEEY